MYSIFIFQYTSCIYIMIKCSKLRSYLIQYLYVTSCRLIITMQLEVAFNFLSLKDLIKPVIHFCKTTYRQVACTVRKPLIDLLHFYAEDNQYNVNSYRTERNSRILILLSKARANHLPLYSLMIKLMIRGLIQK